LYAQSWTWAQLTGVIVTGAARDLTARP